jgi:uncharacterized membrane protein YeaQ/YmgE (transglycosylase-associated protein family)
MLGLILFGFIVGLSFSAYYRVDTARDLIWNIVLAIIASFQGKLLMSLVPVDGFSIPSQVVLIIWVLAILYLKKALIKPKSIRYFG